MRWLGILVVALTAAACGTERPYFESVIVPDDTTNTTGPYVVEASLVAAEDHVRFVTLRLSASNDSPRYVDIAATRVSRSGDYETWMVELPGRPVGTTFHFHMVAVDKGGKKVTYPDDWPKSELSFAIVDGEP